MAVRFGLSRAHAGSHLVDGARRLAGVLGARLNRPVRLVMATDYDHLLEGVQVGGIDLAWMPPVLHARARDALLAAVSERGGAVLYRATILVRDDSPYASVRDLVGARAAWADPRSASGYLFPVLHLRRANIDPKRELERETFFGSAQLAMAAVTDGRADFCASFCTDAAGHDRDRAMDDVQRAFGAIAARLRVLDVTESIPPDGMVLGPAVDGELQARVRDALLAFHEWEDGRSALRLLLDADRLAPVTDAVTRAISRLRTLAA